MCLHPATALHRCAAEGALPMLSCCAGHGGGQTPVAGQTPVGGQTPAGGRSVAGIAATPNASVAGTPLLTPGALSSLCSQGSHADATAARSVQRPWYETGVEVVNSSVQSLESLRGFVHACGMGASNKGPTDSVSGKHQIPGSFCDVPIMECPGGRGSVTPGRTPLRDQLGLNDPDAALASDSRRAEKVS